MDSALTSITSLHPDDTGRGIPLLVHIDACDTTDSALLQSSTRYEALPATSRMPEFLEARHCLEQTVPRYADIWHSCTSFRRPISNMAENPFSERKNYYRKMVNKFTKKFNEARKDEEHWQRLHARASELQGELSQVEQEMQELQMKSEQQNEVKGDDIESEKAMLQSQKCSPEASPIGRHSSRELRRGDAIEEGEDQKHLPGASRYKPGESLFDEDDSDPIASGAEEEQPLKSDDEDEADPGEEPPRPASRSTELGDEHSDDEEHHQPMIKREYMSPQLQTVNKQRTISAGNTKIYELLPDLPRNIIRVGDDYYEAISCARPKCLTNTSAAGNVLSGLTGLYKHAKASHPTEFSAQAFAQEVIPDRSKLDFLRDQEFVERRELDPDEISNISIGIIPEDVRPRAAVKEKEKARKSEVAKKGKAGSRG